MTIELFDLLPGFIVMATSYNGNAPTPSNFTKSPFLQSDDEGVSPDVCPSKPTVAETAPLHELAVQAQPVPVQVKTRW